MISTIINEITKKRLSQSELSGKIKFLAFHQFYQSVIPVKKKKEGWGKHSKLARKLRCFLDDSNFDLPH